MLLLEQLIGCVLDDKYLIEKKLGQGGMGAVYLSTHIGTKRSVAVKVISPDYMTNQEFVERFKREAEAAGRLRHPNVVNVTDFGFADVSGEKVAYLVMEYLDGSTLGALFRKRSRLPLGFVVDIVDQVCLAIDRAHRQGIIHRDLKPDNIWLEPSGLGRYNVKVLDFGLAKLRNLSATVDDDSSTITSKYRLSASPNAPLQVAVDQNAPTVIVHQDMNRILSVDKEMQMQSAAESPKNQVNLTMAGAVLGTPLYMSPEQCRGERLDARSDIYSLGVVVYQMLAGETPFEGDLFQLIKKHTQSPPPPLREKRRDISAAVESLIISALAKKPSDRPTSAASFAIALRANAEGELSLLREAFDLYRKNFSAFVRLSLRVYLPFVLLLAPALGLSASMDISSSITLSALYLLIPLLLIQFANAINTAVFSLVVKQLRASPNSAIQTDQIFSALLKQLRTIIAATAKSVLHAVVDLFKFVNPRLNAYLDSSLYAPIVMIEGKKCDAALLRSKALTDRLRSVATLLQIRNLLSGFFALILSVPISIFFILLFDLLKLLFVPKIYILAVFAGITVLPLSFGYPPIAVALSLAYFKARQAGGETLSNDMIYDIEPEDAAPIQSASYSRLFFASIIIIASVIVWIATRNVFLLAAVETGNIHTVRALIIAGADVNAKDYAGRDPFMIAAVNGNREVMKALRDAGANISVAALPGSQKTDPAMPGMSLIEGGNLRMGGAEGYFTEHPVHNVWIDSFYIDLKEVTNEQFIKFINATGYKTDAEKVEAEIDWKTYFTPERAEHPVVCISWNDANAYADWAGKRLPTEAEWEYAARGGYLGELYPWGGDSPDNNCNFGNLIDETNSSELPTIASGCYKPNGYGIFEMSGNVWEWCSDWYDPVYYRKSPKRNPQGPLIGKARVLRGGSWYTNLNTIRVAARNSDIPENFQYDYGFRCAKNK